MQKINRRQFLGALTASAVAASVCGSASGSFFSNKSVTADVKNIHVVDKPNIIFMLIDDLGPEWVSCFGADDIQTPNIDALAAGGMKFTNAWSMPQCTPSRTTLMTGQYPFRTGWVNHWDVPRWGCGCHFDWKHNISFARVVKTAGYVTASAGKWQINDFRVTPDAMVKHGFDEYCMWTGGEGGANVDITDQRYWDPYIHTVDGSKTYTGRFGEDIYSDFLIDFMRRNKQKPMMLYYAMCLTHEPLTTTPLEPNASGTLGMHKAMVRYVDYCVKKMVDALNELGIRQRTIIFLCGDNGTATNITGHLNGRTVKGGKASITENGIWTPLVVNGPGLVPAGIVKDTLVDLTDIMPTFAEIAGAQLPQGVVIDGHSFAKVVLGKESDGTRQWSCALGAGNDGFKLENNMIVPANDLEPRAIREKKYKIHVNADRVITGLYDLPNDPAETNNLVDSTNPEHVAAKNRLAGYLALQPAKDASPQYDPMPAQSWDRYPYTQPT